MMIHAIARQAGMRMAMQTIAPMVSGGSMFAVDKLKRRKYVRLREVENASSLDEEWLRMVAVCVDGWVLGLSCLQLC